MALRGNLKELSLPDIFQLVMFSGKTGVLRISREDGAHGSVWFRDGEIFFAQSNWRTEPLGERLVRAQRITPMALKRAIDERAREPEGGRRLGQILVEGGYITDKVLEAFVQEQMQDTIFDLMRWDDGEFEFEAMPEAINEDIGLSVSVENVIMEGSRRLEEWNLIKRKIPSTDIVFKMATAPGEGTFEISLKPAEWNLLLLIDGSRSVAELARATSHTDFEVARIIYGLFSAGLLEVATDKEVAAAHAERARHEAELAAVEAAAAKTAEAVVEPVEVAPAPAPASEAPPEPVAATLPEAAPATPASAAHEVPEFLGAESMPPTAADAAALDEVMGALLAPPPEAPPTPALAAPLYTPAEEPAFIAASQEAGQVEDEPAASLEELLAGIREAEPEAVAEPESATTVELEPEAEAEPEPAVKAEPETEPEPLPVSAVVSEPEPVPDFEFIPVDMQEEPTAAAVAGPPEEPGSFVVVPQPAAASAAPEADLEAEEGAEIKAVIEEAPAAADAPEIPAPPVVEPVPPTPVPASPVAKPAPAPPAASAPPAVPGLSAYEQDLMALGLGELPPALRPQDAMPVGPAEEEPITLEPIVEPMGVIGDLEALPEPDRTVEREETGPAPTSGETPPDLVAANPAAVSGEDRPVDFSALLESLDISADDADTNDVPPAPAAAKTVSAGVISTDAYLDDLALDSDFGIGGELTDELSALTGADRPVRPAVSVHRLPAKGEVTLRRDARVNRDTLLKIIDGIKSL